MRKLSSMFISFFFAFKIRLEELKFEFCLIKLGQIYTDKLAINWQNFAQVGLQLKFASSGRNVFIQNVKANTAIDYSIK